VTGKADNTNSTFWNNTSSLMKGYLTGKGVAKESIIEECEGMNTYQSTEICYDKIIKPKRWISGIIVSNAEHLPRIILQTMKIISPELLLFYSGPKIEDSMERTNFLEHEKNGIDDMFRKYGL